MIDRVSLTPTRESNVKSIGRPISRLAVAWQKRNHTSARLAILGVMVIAIGVAPRMVVADDEFFEKQIRPIMVEHCQSCHGEAKHEGGLKLSSQASFVKGGDSGPVAVPGEPDESRLIKVIEYVGEIKMPPRGKLSDVDIGKLRQWIKMGAPWPASTAPRTADGDRGAGFQITTKQQNWWAFQPVRDGRPPTVQHTAWPRNEIDQFVLAELESRGLSPNGAADRQKWLRRASFDLTGLPPTPEEIDAFVADNTDSAYETVVKRLLASHSYGQRWARHWLDVVRYADHFDANPATRVAEYDVTEAWRYRDWVVDAFNADLPFDQFIIHQIAGDLLPSPVAAEIYPEGLIATTFLTNGVWDVGDADKEKIVSDMADDNIDVIGKTFLGLTLGCARCHDHKFDPISTEDYYGLAGMFYSSHMLKELGTKGGNYTIERSPLIGPTALAERSTQEQHLASVKSKLDELDRQRRLLELTSGGKLLVPTKFQSAAGAIGLISEDASITVSGTLGKDTYTIATSAPPEIEIRFLRLEALSDPSLPAQGPGRASDGNFVISRLALAYTSPDTDAALQPIKLVSAKADFEQTGFPVASALDDDLKDGWAVSPVLGRAHAAVFEVTPDTRIPAGAELVITIVQQHAETHALGKFRLSVTDAILPQPLNDSPERQDLVMQQTQLQAQLAPPVPLAMAMREGGTPGGLFPGIQDVPIHVRGSYTKLGPVVPRRLPRFLAGEQQTEIASGSGRRQLAEWVASPANPLTARVIVNRVWQWHFGAGLVRTPSNFGLLSEPPTHPALLDWLTARFIEDGWSLKKLHQRIMLSAAYQQSGSVSREKFEADPENRWLGRYSSRRLEAEAIRDALLSVSGQLDPKFGGPAVDDFATPRRSLYVQTARWDRGSYAILFDAANPDSSVEARTVSTVAPQSLFLLNNGFSNELARHLAERLVREIPSTAADSVNSRIQHAYRLLLGRPPHQEEILVAQQIVAAAEFDSPMTAWVDLAHVLLCTNEFVYLD